MISAALYQTDEGPFEPRELDDDLVAARRGDADAQGRIYEKSRRYVHRLTARIVGYQEADDVTQQVYLRLFGSLDKFSGRSRLLTWLYRLAVNESLHHLRRNKRIQRLLSEWRREEWTEFASADVERREALEAALRTLEPDLRDVFLLREAEDLSYQEIAQLQGISEGTVGSRLNRARRTLRRKLEEQGWEL